MSQKKITNKVARKLRVLFVVQNGIGYGHLRRALLVSDALRNLSDEVQLMILSQAKSTNLLEGSGIPAVNFPFLDRLPSPRLRAAYDVVLGNLVRQYGPDVIIEDTIPLFSLRQCESCTDCFRLLLMRRIAPSHFEDRRVHGELGWYHTILYLDDEAHFRTQRFSFALRVLFKLHHRLRKLALPFKRASETEITAVKSKYCDEGQQIIAVTCGAGGEQDNHRDAQALFESTYSIASSLNASNLPLKWLFIVGPYYQGPDLTETGHIRVLRYECKLPALLQAADIVIARPGINATYEALAGSGEVILVPGFSYHEKQQEWCTHLSQTYDGVRVASLDQLRGIIKDLGAAGPRKYFRILKEGSHECAKLVLELARAKTAQSPDGMLLRETAFERFTQHLERLLLPHWAEPPNTSVAQDLFQQVAEESLLALDTETKCSIDSRMELEALSRRLFRCVNNTNGIADISSFSSDQLWIQPRIVFQTY